jgi:hypothetical protein
MNAALLSPISVGSNQTPINVTLDPGVQVFVPANTINNAVGLSSTTAAGPLSLSRRSLRLPVQPTTASSPALILINYS